MSIRYRKYAMLIDAISVRLKENGYFIWHNDGYSISCVNITCVSWSQSCNTFLSFNTFVLNYDQNSNFFYSKVSHFKLLKHIQFRETDNFTSKYYFCGIWILFCRIKIYMTGPWCLKRYLYC